MNYSKKHPCAECPFLKGSAPGWLGPDKDPEKLINAILGLQSFGPVFMGKEPENFACHISTASVVAAAKCDTLPDELKNSVQHCVGALIMLKARGKRPHDREKSDAMNRVSATEPMLRTRDEFIKHHTPPALEKWRK